MSNSIDKPKLNNLADEIWKTAQRLRGKFKAHEYQVVILPMITIRRLECVLIQWRERKATEIRAERKSISDEQLEKLVKGFEANPMQAPGFSNPTTWTLRKIYEEDHTRLAAVLLLLQSQMQPEITARSTSLRTQTRQTLRLVSSV